MRQRIPLVAVALGAVLLFSACFPIRGFFWTVGKIPRGEKGVLVLQTRPTSQNPDRTYVIFIIGVPNPNEDPAMLSLVNPRKFDVNGKFGGPYTLVRDDVMRDDLVGGISCEGFLGSGTEEVRWRLYRTTTRVRDRGEIGKIAQARFGFKATNDAEGIEQVIAASGGWQDADEDGVYTPGDLEKDLAGCSSSVMTNIPVGPPTSDTAARKVYLDTLK